ncbi:hypothetical protein ACFRU3_48170, partial [Streptomyces sp. NPDC056910]
MQHDNDELADLQRQHWQRTYTDHPGMYGEQPSGPAVHAADIFRARGAKDVLELGAGHGRDALYFAREGFSVQATDFSVLLRGTPGVHPWEESHPVVAMRSIAAATGAERTQETGPERPVRNVPVRMPVRQAAGSVTVVKLNV